MIKKENWFYIVKKNDDLQKISTNCKTSPIKILILNNITPQIIKEGKILIIK